MTSTVENALDDVKRRYDELNRALSGLFPQFRDASEKLLNELIRKVQELQQKEDIYRARAENDKARIDRLEEENQLLRKDKLDHEKLRTISDRQNMKLDEYSGQIDMLSDQNKQLSDQYRYAEHELASLRQKNNDLTAELSRKSHELEEFRDQCELDKRTELNNQAINHQHALSSTKETLQKALKKLKADFDQQANVLKKCNDEVVHLRKELKNAPLKYRAQAIQELQKMPLAEANRVIIPTSESRYRIKDNPVRPMQQALGGSSNGSSSISSSSHSRSHISNVGPARKRTHYGS